MKWIHNKMVEEIALTEDILDKKGDFVNTFFEFISKEGTQIIEFGSVNGGTTQIYRVPDKHIFYLTTLTISGSNNSSNSNTAAGIEITGPIVKTFLIRLVTDVGPSVPIHDAITLSFNPPLRFEENTIFSVGSAVRGDGIITGIEIKKEIAVRR